MRQLCLFLLAAQATFAAAINGIVKDASGGVVTGAAVELREVPGPG